MTSNASLLALLAAMVATGLCQSPDFSIGDNPLSVDVCQGVLQKIPKKDLGEFADYKIKSCSSLVVRGAIYNLIMEGNSPGIPKCTLRISMSLSRNFTLDTTKVKNEDCFKLKDQLAAKAN